jgi:hypothetical protein
MSSQLQHNSPTRGWVPCEAKVKCRFEHRNVEVSDNLDDHKAVINAAAADGKIDAVERATLSKGLTDAIFAKRDTEALGTKPYDGYTQTVSPEIPDMENIPAGDRILEHYNYGLSGYRVRYHEHSQEANRIRDRLRYAQDDLSEAIGLRMYYTKEGLDERWDEIGTGKETPEEKVAIVEAHRIESEKQIPKADRRVKEARESVDILTIMHRDQNALASQAKDNYDNNKAMVGSAVDSYGIPYDYFKQAEYGHDLAYNRELRTLQQDANMSQETKTEIMAERRLEVIRKAIRHYKEGADPSVVDRITNRLDDFKYGLNEEEREMYKERARSEAQAAGPRIAAFAKAFKDAPWDTFIGGQ